MLKVLRYRVYPTKAQKTTMNNTLELCRWTYNETLALRKDAWESEQKNIGYYDSKKMIPEWKKEKPELKTVHSQVLQEVIKRVDLAFQAFFRRVKQERRQAILDSEDTEGMIVLPILNQAFLWILIG